MKISFKKIPFEIYFKIALILKAIDGFFETLGGIILFFVNPSQINSFFKLIFLGELIEDPKDFIANFLISFSNKISLNVEFYSAVYLLSHGIIKIALVYALLKRKLWAYPVAIAIFSLFLVVQIYLLILKFNIFYLLLSILDIIVIVLVVWEYKHLRTMKNS